MIEVDALAADAVANGLADEAADAAPGEGSCTDVARALLACPPPADQLVWRAEAGSMCGFEVTVLQRFVNRVAGALRLVDPAHLVTLGASSYCTTTHGGDRGAANLWSDQCLSKAGNDPFGTIDVWQVDWSISYIYIYIYIYIYLYTPKPSPQTLTPNPHPKPSSQTLAPKPSPQNPHPKTLTPKPSP